MQKLTVRHGTRFRGGMWLLALLQALAITIQAPAARVIIMYNNTDPRVAFAAKDVDAALKGRGQNVVLSGFVDPAKTGDAIRILLAERTDATVIEGMKSQGASPPGTLRAEGFSIRAVAKPRQSIWVIGADSAGVMYGGLELSEVIRIEGLSGVKDVDQNAYMAMRGTKFNIPLDVRTPSYTDVSDVAQHNIIEMWNFDFWKEYIDTLARYRYNFVSLWSLHPFPSLVKVPDYPDVALDDVQRSTVNWKERYSLNGNGFDAPEIINNVETLKKMTMEDKIAFWRKVMKYGKDRNVDFYFVTWNIFVNGTGGKYGITDDIGNKTTIDYFRKSVKQMFQTYPDLKGIGLTTGENMPGAGFEQKENWAFETYAQGVLDAAAEQPGRKITFIHRQHQTGAKDIARKFTPLIEDKDIEFIFSFKYAKAHVYSSTVQTYHPGFVKDIREEGDLKTIWTLRNDDIYHFRWGAPDFVREFIQNIPYEVSRGYYYGSDQYIWGREFLSTEPETPRQIEIAKHWYQWMLWGRLGYDPTIGNERFVKIIQARFPDVPGEELFTAWQEASMIYPKTTGFHWGSLDFQWYIESSKSAPGPAQTPSGFHDVNRFITLPPHPGTDYISIPDYVKSVVGEREVAGTTPIELSKQIHAHADKALKLLDGLSHGGHKELRRTMEDIRTIAYLGKYYAHKIRGATELALFRATKNEANQHAAIEELRHAAHFWRLYASTALGQYKNPLWTNRVGYVDWRGLFTYVLDDIEIAGVRPTIDSMTPTPGGDILEAERAASAGMQKAASVAGYTGNGYLDAVGGSGQRWVEWKYEASAPGTYIIELRYALEGEDQHPSKLTVNGEDIGNIILWTTGDKSTWAWDRKPVALKKGVNTIRLQPRGLVRIDHLNVLFGGSTEQEK